MILSKVVGRRIFTIQRRISLLCLWQFLTKATASHKIVILCYVFVDLHPPIFIEKTTHPRCNFSMVRWQPQPESGRHRQSRIPSHPVESCSYLKAQCQVIRPAIHWAIGAIITIIAPKPQSLMCFDWDSEPIQHGTNWTLDWFKIPITIDQLVWV